MYFVGHVITNNFLSSCLESVVSAVQAFLTSKGAGLFQSGYVNAYTARNLIGSDMFVRTI